MGMSKNVWVPVPRAKAFVLTLRVRAVTCETTLHIHRPAQYYYAIDQAVPFECMPIAALSANSRAKPQPLRPHHSTLLNMCAWHSLGQSTTQRARTQTSLLLALQESSEWASLDGAAHRAANAACRVGQCDSYYKRHTWLYNRLAFAWSLRHVRGTRVFRWRQYGRSARQERELHVAGRHSVNVGGPRSTPE